MSSWRVILWVRDITLRWHLQEFLKNWSISRSWRSEIAWCQEQHDVEKIWTCSVVAFWSCLMLDVACQCVIKRDIIGKIPSDWTSRLPAVSLNTVVDFSIRETRVLNRCCLSDFFSCLSLLQYSNACTLHRSIPSSKLDVILLLCCTNNVNGVIYSPL